MISWYGDVNNAVLYINYAVLYIKLSTKVKNCPYVHNLEIGFTH